MLSDLGRRMGSHPGPNNRDEVIDYITKFYHNDIEQFYPELK